MLTVKIPASRQICSSYSQRDRKAEALTSVCILAIFPLLIIRETQEQWREKKLERASHKRKTARYHRKRDR